MAGRTLAHDFRRGADGWRHNGRPVPGLSHLVDLDFGFTPATNLQQLRRAALAPGGEADLPAAWFDLETSGLTELRQHYARLDGDRYAYRAPDLGYTAVLEFAASGFVRLYPGLWEMAE